MSQEPVSVEGRSVLALASLRAAVDRGFRRRLLRDPRRAIRETFGVEVSPGLRLKFIEKGKHLDLLVVLPDLVREPGSLPAGELDAVLGGTYAWAALPGAE